MTPIAGKKNLTSKKPVQGLLIRAKTLRPPLTKESTPILPIDPTPKELGHTPCSDFRT